MEEQEPKYVIKYTIHIHDNHGTINIKQSGKPDEDPPDPTDPDPGNP